MSGGLRGALGAARRSWLTSNGGALFFISATAVNLGNFAFHVVVSRLLGPASYGALSALLGFILTLSVPVSAMQAVLTKQVAERSRSTDDHPWITPLLLKACAVGAGLFVAVLAALPFL